MGVFLPLKRVNLNNCHIKTKENKFIRYIKMITLALKGCALANIIFYFDFFLPHIFFTFDLESSMNFFPPVLATPLIWGNLKIGQSQQSHLLWKVEK